MLEFELFYSTVLHCYGAKVRNGEREEIWHQPTAAKLKNILSAQGLWPSVQIPKLVLEAGAVIVIKIPIKPNEEITENTDIRPFELRGIK